MDELEAAIITKTDHGFEVTDDFGEILGSFRDWGQVADMFRKRDFSVEYIAKRRADLDRGPQPKSLRRTSNVWPLKRRQIVEQRIQTGKRSS
jgi:hypothetical protein